ncbi:TIGR00645 family protein [Thiorhodococcus mannitoliphagus]|uniref:UPF0114 protein G3480_26530 n=1 Tax=Thiorhodococcus mannitoliphagus TaxID=329406 RepID=A0A6P1E004_9GAMM|nr:TIGR00645 family protein [Thiorhodococcus mannitoliphagus]NEX23778.1 TIGR00645 family protein [Thiorhodococcus mannitoliphagus]
MERFIERLLFASRWILAPIYLGMSLMLIALAVKFFQEIWHVMAHLWTLSEADLILASLALVDLALVASLVVMVMFAGFENFVAKMDIAEDAKKLGWLGKLDASTLKLKVAISIVAISSIHLLSAFMNLGHISGEKLTWYVVIHLTFVVSALLMGLLDRLVFASHREH